MKLAAIWCAVAAVGQLLVFGELTLTPFVIVLAIAWLVDATNN